MGADSKIEWTHHTFNPWWGCQRVSPGCEHCYAETFSKRVGLKLWGPTNERRFFGDKHWAEPLKWNRDAERSGERRRVFCASMADVLDDRPELVDPRARLQSLIIDTPWLVWLLLTKRPQNALRLLSEDFIPMGVWPANVWLGTTVEDQTRARERIPHLRDTDAPVRFLSCEPLLGPVTLSPVELAGVHWVIVGSESGPGARPMAIEWARSLVNQCVDAGVPVHVKQIANPKDRKGGNPEHWPPGNWPRQYPTTQVTA